MSTLKAVDDGVICRNKNESSGWYLGRLWYKSHMYVKAQKGWSIQGPFANVARR